MQKITPEDGQSANIIEENIAHLKALFPDAFTEGGVNFDVLRQLLGDANVLDEGEEKYGLNWYGKKAARQIALTPSAGTLLPRPDQSVDWDTTQNLFIEGDNLEVLKLLQKSYANSIKVIYIDPPYNTGGEFIYPDRFQENLETYLKYTGQISDDGMKFSSSTETTGRRHTAWMNMMLPRLRVARSLLTADGYIFISIDENEGANLRLICDEVFGEENFLAEVAWKHTQQSKNDEPYFSRNKNTLIVYRKSDQTKPFRFPRIEADNQNYSNPDNDPKGDWRSGDVRSPSFRPTLKYDIVTPSGKVISPPDNGWRWSQDAVLAKIASGEIIFSKDESRIIRKIYLSEQDGRTPENVWAGERFGTTRGANSQIKSLFDGRVPFDTPKPIELIEAIIDLCHNDKDFVVLDFFAGSASTAHAVMNSNAQNGANRKFICVQLPEIVAENSVCAELGFENIADISRERIIRAGKAIKSQENGKNVDVGFRSFSLSNSNIVAWNPDRHDLEKTLLSHSDHLVDGRTDLDILTELLLKRGIELTAPIEKRVASGKAIYSVGFGVLFACLEGTIGSADVEQVGQAILDWHKELEPEADSHVFFRDSAFADDIAKTNMAAILVQNGISHVRSL